MSIPDIDLDRANVIRRAVVDLGALGRNARRLIGDAPVAHRVIADVRADAFGHGAEAIAATLAAAGIETLLVSRAEDAADFAHGSGALPVIALRRPGGAHSELTDALILGPELYGLDSEAVPDPSEHGLVPVMTLEATVLATKRVGRGEGVSYGYVYRTTNDTTLAMVSLGYSDGIDRHACEGGVVWLRGGLHPIAGRVAMDVFMIDVGETPVDVGDSVVLFGDPSHGHPSPSDWARVLHKTGAEVTSTLGDRIERSYR